MKDLVDMVLLLDAAPVDESVQAELLRAVFTARGTHPMPLELPPPPTDWRAAYARLAVELPVPPTSDGAYAYVSEKLRRSLSLASHG